jgi:hypothetical protein
MLRPISASDLVRRIFSRSVRAFGANRAGVEGEYIPPGFALNSSHPKARSPSGKAMVCKTIIGGSIPPRASKIFHSRIRAHMPTARWHRFPDRIAVAATSRQALHVGLRLPVISWPIPFLPRNKRGCEEDCNEHDRKHGSSRKTPIMGATSKQDRRGDCYQKVSYAPSGTSFDRFSQGMIGFHDSPI